MRCAGWSSSQIARELGLTSRRIRQLIASVEPDPDAVEPNPAESARCCLGFGCPIQTH